MVSKVEYPQESGRSGIGHWLEQGRLVRWSAITKEWVLRELLDNAERAKTDGSWAARNRSLELVGKEIGMFGDQPPPQPPRTLEDLPTEILEQILRESAAAEDKAEEPTDVV